MKNHLILFIPLVLGMLSLATKVMAESAFPNSQPFNSSSVVQTDRTDASVMQNGYRGYQSQIYEVGTTYVPSDYSNPAGAPTQPQKSAPRKLGGGTDPGEQDDGFPIGEPWILLVFSLLFGGVIFLKARKTKALIEINHNTTNMNNNTHMKNNIVNKTSLTLLLLLTLGVGQMWADGGIGYKGVKFTKNGSVTGWYNIHDVSWSYYNSTYDCRSGQSGVTNFNNADLGTVTTLKLKAFVVIGWTNSSDYVAGRLQYRLYKQSASAPSYTNLNVGNYGSTSNTSSAADVLASSGNDRVVGKASLTTDIVTSSTAAGNYFLQLKGLGRMQWSNGSSYGNFNANDGSEVKATLLVPGFTTTSTSNAYGSVNIGSNSSTTISFTQHYGTTLTTSNCALSGTNSFEFEVTGISETGVTVKFKPSTAGSKSATLTITDANSKTCTITLTGTGTTPPGLTVVAGIGISAVTGSDNDISAGDNIAITATVATGYTWDRWTLTGSGTLSTFTATTRNQTVTVGTAASMTLTASATENMSTLSTSCHYDAGNPSYAAPSVSGSATTVGYATTRTITATAAGTGYTFAGWTLTNCTRTDVGAANATSITIRSNGDGAAATVVANYEEDLSSPWIVAGGNKIVTTGTTWRTTADANNTMLKQSGHSAESVVYFTVPVTVTNTGASNGDYKFKIINTSTSTWYGLDADGQYWVLRENDNGVTRTLSTSGADIELRADVVGDYLIKVDYSSGPTITVYFPLAVTWTAASVYSGGEATITATVNDIESGKSLRYELFAGATATGDALATYNATTSATTDSHNFAVTPSFGANETSQYTVKVTYDGSQTATYTSYVYRKWDIYVQDNCSWGNIYHYNWDGSGNAGLGSWPGTASSVYSGSWHTITLDAKYPTAILHGNNNQQTNDITVDISTYSPGTFWNFNWTHDYDSKKYYDLNSVTISNPTVTLTTYDVISTTQIYVEGAVTDYGNDGNSASEMQEVGFKIGETKYTTTCTNGATFKRYITGLTANTSYSVKAYATNLNGTGESSATAHTTRATGSYTIKVRTGASDPVPYIRAFVWSDEDCGGSGVTDNASGNGVAMTLDITGSVYKWYSYSMSNEYQKFYISENGSNETWDQTAPMESTCYWYHRGAAKNDRIGTMTCPYTTPQLMIETTAGSGDFEYLEMTTSPSISKTVTLAAKSTYKFKPVYNSEWYGKASTTLTRASNSASSLSASVENDLQLTTDAAGDYTFTFTAPNTISVTYPVAYTVTFGAGDINGSSTAIGATADPSFTSGDYVLKTTAVTFTKGSTVNGYTWSGWYSNADGTGTLHSATDANWTSAADTRTADISVYACYTKINYTITYNLNGGTNPVDPAPVTSYTVTDDVTLPTPTKSGYRFLGWYDNAEFTGSPIASFAAGTYGNKTYYANWVEMVTFNVYFYNKDNWATPKAYLWENGSDPLVKNAAWPGEAMSVHQGQVYQYDYEFTDGYDKIQFNDGTDANKTSDLNLPATNSWFYNPEGAGEWTRYLMVAAFPTETIAAVLGEKVTVEPVVAWADGINFSDLDIISARTSGSSDVDVVVAGTKLQITATAAGTANFTITYSYGGTTITKTMVVQIKDGVTIQAKIAKTDTKWTDMTKVKMHYWGTSIGNSDLTMAWIKEDDDYNYYQACVPKGSDGKANFLFYYDYMENTDANRWRQTADQTNITGPMCYTVGYEGHNNVKSNCSGESGVCVEIWQLQIVMGSGDIYTSNVVSGSSEVVSFFAPSNANESHTYRQGTVTLERNGSTVYTYPANTFSASGVYTAKINVSSYALTDLALYTGDYYIRTDPSAGGWDNYKETASNKMTKFTRNTNFPNETFSYYWVDNVAKTPGDQVNIKATVANDYNPVLCNFSADDNVTREEHGINLRFGYEPTTNDFVRGILRGASFNNFLNIVRAGTSLIYNDIDIEHAALLDEGCYSSRPEYSDFQDKSNWVYEIIVYAKIDDDHDVADVILKSYYNGVQHLLGMVKDNYGRETSTPISFPIIQTGTTNGIYGLRVVYDFKTNRLFGAWAPADRVVDGVLNVDADIMFLRHEDGDAAQISFKTGNPSTEKVTDLNQAIFAMELDNEDTSHGGSGNIERHYFLSLPFNCQVSNIFGIGGYMEYWGIQRYRGDLRAEKGWFKDTPTFWEWLSPSDIMQAGEGYLLSVDKKLLETNGVWKDGIIYQAQEVLKDGSGNPIKTADGLSDSIGWVTKTDGSMLTMYFPSTTSGFEIQPATGAALTISYPDQKCTITRNNRDKQDSNWKCIGTPGYKNITISSYYASSPDLVYDNNTAPSFLYSFNEQNTGATYAKGTYTVRDGSTWTYHSFNSYMVQFAGTINWAQYSQNKPSSVAARRMPQAETLLTRAEINLMSDEDESLDRTFVWLHDDATVGFDQNYDLNKIVESKVNQIYSLAEADVPFAANVLPLETDTVALVVNIAKNGEYTFSLNTDTHVGMAPVLYDMFESVETNMQDADYTVTLQKGKYEGRFYLIFHPVKPIVTSFETTEDGGMNVQSGEAIYDVLGRRVNTIYPDHIYIVNGEKRICH